MPERSPAERSLAGRAGAYALHARVADPSAHTAPARRAFEDRFEREVDPDGTLPSDVRARMAEYARKQYFLNLARKSAEARRKAANPAPPPRRRRSAGEDTGNAA